MMKLICFGDSNTFGYDPRSPIGERYCSDSRWVDILAQRTGWEVRNNGMNGRKIPCRETAFSRSTDLLVIMLGTNDLLQGNSAIEVSERMERFLNILTIDRAKILLIAPPPMQYGEWVDDKMIESSSALAEFYRSVSKRTNIHFADAGEWSVSLSYDGVHFTEGGHKTFANQLYHFLMSNFAF